jgi:hypothetical protein
MVFEVFLVIICELICGKLISCNPIAPSPDRSGILFLSHFLRRQKIDNE